MYPYLLNITSHSENYLNSKEVSLSKKSVLQILIQNVSRVQSA